MSHKLMRYFHKPNVTIHSKFDILLTRFIKSRITEKKIFEPTILMKTGDKLLLFLKYTYGDNFL